MMMMMIFISHIANAFLARDTRKCYVWK